MIVKQHHRRLCRWLSALLLLLLASAPAHAAVELSFYSREFGANFPHAFIRLQGTLESTGEEVDATFGFTAKTISPAILMGSVTGEVIPSKPDYVAGSDRQIVLRISDAEYGTVIAAVDAWRNLPQPSYNLNRRNCVFFVADIARLIGMTAETPARLMKKPRSYLQFLARANAEWLSRRGGISGQ